MLIAVDFDGTCVDHRFPEIGPDAPGCSFWLKNWVECDARLVLWTVRSNGQKHGNVLDDALRWFLGHGIELYGVNENPQQKSWSTSPKAYCQLYVDDAAFGCPLIKPEGFVRPCVDWKIVGPTVLGRIVG